MREKRRVILPVFRRVVPADLENWLERMAAEGWHINRVRQWSSLMMTFRRGEPKKYRFVCDFQASRRKEYMATYEQFGWEYLGRMASMYVWRMGYDDERPEAFSDRDSRVGRNRRTILAVSVSFTLFLIMILFYAVQLIFFSDSLSPGDRNQLIAVEVFFSIFVALLGWVMIYIWKNRMR
jgi:hypothetical protein